MQVVYPVLLFRKGYVYLANGPLELCVHPRSMFADTEARSAAGEFALVDASGAHCAVTGWRRVSVFGGLSALPYLLTRSVFARPSLRIIAQLDVDAMRALVASQLALRYRTAHESGVGGAQSFRELLASAGSPAELLRVVARERLA